MNSILEKVSDWVTIVLIAIGMYEASTGHPADGTIWVALAIYSEVQRRARTK